MFTIKDLSEGRCAVIHDGSIEDLKTVIKAAFPNSYRTPLGSTDIFYCASEYNNSEWVSRANYPRELAQSVRIFLKEISQANKFTPKFGDKVLVSQNNKTWYVKKFISITNDPEYKYAVTDWEDDNCFFKHGHYMEFYKFVKKPKVIVSKRDIAIWKGCNVEDIKII